MPKGTPKIGSKPADIPAGSQILGTITNTRVLDPQPQRAQTQYEADNVSVSVTEPPPPWELESDSSLTQSDARRFVDAPDNITLRWINPRVLDAEGWRDWQPVMVTDPRFRCHVQTMVSPEGNIRRGGPTGDLLAWMYTSWVVSRRKRLAEQTLRQTNNSKAEQEKLFEDFKRGKYGPYMHLDKAQHPSHTMAEGRSMTDN